MTLKICIQHWRLGSYKDLTKWWPCIVQMATGYSVCVHIVYQHHEISYTGTQSLAGPKSYGSCVEIVWKSCIFRAVVSATGLCSFHMENVWSLFSFCTEAARRRCCDCLFTMLFFSFWVPKVTFSQFCLCCWLCKMRLNLKPTAAVPRCSWLQWSPASFFCSAFIAVGVCHSEPE